jgi:hypothetical protein
MTRESISKIVSRLSEDSQNITFINDCADGEWEEVTNYRQMIECLRHGEVLSGPVWDEKSNTHKCRMGYFHAGQDIVLKIAIEEEKHLYILNVCQE